MTPSANHVRTTTLIFVVGGDSEKKRNGMGKSIMADTTNETVKTQGMNNKELTTHSKEELKKEELIGVLASLIKNYVCKKQQSK